jgi:hypothetical protein
LSEPVENQAQIQTTPEQVTGAPVAPPEETGPAATEREASLADTAGTGTIVALGCIGGTVFLIVLGLIYLLVTQLFG